MSTQREKIIKKAKEILERSPQGVRYSELVRQIHEEYPRIKVNDIRGSVWEFKRMTENGEIRDAVVEKGLYILTKYLGEREATEGQIKIREEDFYQPFADYLVNDLEECTKAIPLGGNRFQDRWGTPDVIGIYKFSETDPIKPPIEIISAEIKTDTNQLITAFGQSCAYKLFSHKVYLVIPKDAEREISRLESLCLRFGIGLILFDRNNPEEPKFEIRTRPIKSEPDYFYVNKYLRLLGAEEKKLF